ncbi:hypothetical protein PSI23_06195 [Xenorhabdus sp. XENO-10]|uniref:Uncharacterized protein n=1 Tax=Xenorhabdus yunnanensis TaxID=3025878 RepID=A0ABT5LED4_9GAMM|nr:hypothetical protein [Xenorhabdus yunnanensis]MDC9588918.1 hypothetical protein [Xenorhabdus yunnanensis]
MSNNKIHSDHNALPPAILKARKLIKWILIGFPVTFFGLLLLQSAINISPPPNC